MSRRSSALYASLLALSTAVFAALAACALVWTRGAELDVRFVAWVHGSTPEALVDTMRVLTYAGSALVLGPLAVATAVLLSRAGRPYSGVFVVAAFAGSEVVDQALKAGFRRARPELDDPFLQLTTYSFPSGHAFAATATYGALALVLAALVDRSRRARLFVVASALVVLVAASRVVLGVHYLFDVLAGVAGGVALLCALLLVLEPRFSTPFRSLARKQQPKRLRLDA